MSTRVAFSGMFAAVLLAVGLFSPSAHAECGRVTIADMNWASAEFAANVDRFILEKGYGCKVELVPGDTNPTIASMTSRGQPDVAPEIWMNSAREVIDKAVKDGKLTVAGEILSDGGVEGWWIPRYMLEKNPELTTLAAVLKRPDLFPNPEDKSRGALYTCPPGWTCQIVTANLYKAFDVKQAGFDLVNTGSGAGLAGTIARANTRKQAWFGYYWEPTPVLGRYDMVKLDMGVPYSKEEWDRCTGQANCTDPKKNTWTNTVVMTVTSKTFSDKSPEAFAYLSKRSWPNSVVNQILAFMDKERARGEEAAEKFLKENEALWTKWVPSDVAARVKSAL